MGQNSYLGNFYLFKRPRIYSMNKTITASQASQTKTSTELKFTLDSMLEKPKTLQKPESTLAVIFV